jgi:hypothetical protein
VLPAAVEEDGLLDLIVAWGQGDDAWVAHAAAGQLGQDRTLFLQDGALLGAQGGLTFDSLALPLPAMTARPPPSAWPDRQLADSPEPYHQALRHKRTTWPLAGALLLLLAVPCTLTGRAWTVPLSVFGWWAAVRVCDGLVASVGGLTSALLPLGLLLAVTALTWRLWCER